MRRHMGRAGRGPRGGLRASVLSMALPIDDRVGLAPAQRQALEATLAAQHILQDVVRWRMVSAVVTQDEYTHDVVVPWDGGLHLVYDST